MGSAAFFRSHGNAMPTPLERGAVEKAEYVVVELFGQHSASVSSPEMAPFPTIIFDLPDEDAPAAAPPEPTPPVQADCRAALEAFPHLVEKIRSMWGTRGLDTFIRSVLMDSRDGQRQGFSFEAARELMFLAKMNLLVRAIEAAPLLQVSVAEASDLLAGGDHLAVGHAAAAADPWGQHLVKQEKSSRR